MLYESRTITILCRFLGKRNLIIFCVVYIPFNMDIYIQILHLVLESIEMESI